MSDEQTQGAKATADNVEATSAGASEPRAEEQPEAYKDIDQVVDVVERAGLSKRVARLKPLTVIKG